MFVGISIVATNINAFNCHIVYGYPSPFTFWGFAHTIALKLNTTLVNEAVLPINHYYEPRICGDVYNVAFNKYRSANRETIGAAQTDDPRANIDFTVIFELDNENEISDDDIRNVVNKLKFAGGIIDRSKIEIYIDDDEKNVIRRVKKGFITKEKKVDLSKSDNHFQSFFDELKIIKDVKDGWKIPSLLGYGLIEEPKKREKVRFNHLHAFAEPLVGIVKFEYFRKFGDNITSLKMDAWYLIQDNNTIKIVNKG